MSKEKRKKKIDIKKLKVKDFKEASYNPRSITKDALKKLEKSIEHHGDLSTVTINEATGVVIAGHQRLKTIRDKKSRIETQPHTDKHGTVAVGHILVESESGELRIPLRIVNWDKRTEKLANIAANAHGGEFDNQKLGKLLAELDKEQFDIELSGFTQHEVKTLVRKADENPEDKYVRTLASPIYKVRGKKPSFSKMFDVTRATEVREKIEAANLDKATKEFLMEASTRLVKFNFANIAEFYAHADKKVQRLMEEMALVIVDADRAIELGYLTMTKEIAGLVKPENKDKGEKEEKSPKKKKVKDEKERRK